MALRLAISDSGSGPPFVILHGLFGSGRNWGGIARHLAKSYRVLAADLRNHGNSPWAPGMGYPEMAEDLRESLAGLGIASAIVLGHSMGGKAAMRLALAAPSLVSRLIVADIAPLPYKPSLRAYADAMRAIDVSALGTRAEADRILSATIAEPGIRGFLLQNLLPTAEGWRWRLNLDAIAAEMDVICGVAGIAGETPYAGPALFLRGERSDYVRDDSEPAIRALFPRANIQTIAGAGHWLHAEKPKEFVDAVLSWLTE